TGVQTCALPICADAVIARRTVMRIAWCVRSEPSDEASCEGVERHDVINAACDSVQVTAVRIDAVRFSQRVRHAQNNGGRSPVIGAKAPTAGTFPGRRSML